MVWPMLTDRVGFLRLRRQLVEHRVDLGVDLGQRFVRLVIQAQVGGNGAHALHAAGGHVVDAIGLRHGIFQRRGDETGDQIGVGTRICGAHRDHGVLGIGELQHRQQAQRAQAQHQDDQADDRRQYRALDKNIGEFAQCRAGSGAHSSFTSGIGVIRGLNAVVDEHRRIVMQLELPGGDHGIARLQAADHRDLIAARQSGGDKALLHCQLRLAILALARVLDDEHRAAIGVVRHRGIRQRDVLLRAAIADPCRGEQTRQQFAIRVGKARAHLEGTRCGIDLRFDCLDPAGEGFARQRTGGSG